MKDKVLTLTVNEKITGGYPYNLLMASDTAEIFVDDLRAGDDPSLSLVPRITTYTQLVQYFGLGVATRFGGGECPPGEQYYKLVGFYVRSGAAAFIPKVLGADGTPLANILVFASWPGAPAFNLPDGGRPRPDYTNGGGGVAGFTNTDGDIGFGYSGDAIVSYDGTTPLGGPYLIWPAANPESTGVLQYCDAAIKLGWIPETNHLTANPIFQVTTKAGDQPSPTDGQAHILTQAIDGVEISRTVLTVETTLKVANG